MTEPRPSPSATRETGLSSLARIASARAQGWRATAIVLGGISPAAERWVLTDAVRDWHAALGWRRGEEHYVTASLAGLEAWVRIAAERGPRWDKSRSVWIAHEHAHNVAVSLADLTTLEARSWKARSVREAREARMEVSATLAEIEDQITEALSAPGPSMTQAPQPAPYKFVRDLASHFVQAELGTPTLQFMQ